jgi:tRNA wybutosine-synthesizing protein 2
MGFKESLIESLKGTLSEEELLLLPRGFQTIGHIVIIKLNPVLLEKKEIIGEKYLELLPNYIRSVYLNQGIIQGQFREPNKIIYLLGENNPIVEHKEHNVKYKFDITKIMFSKGNIKERKYLATLVKNGEVIIDMFSGIGYFSLPIAKHAKPSKIYSIELNPLAFSFLEENIQINHLEKIIIPIKGDSKSEVLRLSQNGIVADRIIMGVFPAPIEYIESALSVAKEGTIIHYEGIASKEDYLDLFNEFKEKAGNLKFKCKLLTERFVKSYGPHLYHVVLDIVITNK